MNTQLRLLVLVVALGFGPAAVAHVFIGPSWPTGSIPLRLQLDATAPSDVSLPLNDGAQSWDAIAQGVIAEWNTALVRSRFTATSSASAEARYGDGVTNIIFASNVYGAPFPGRTLAITLVGPLDDDPDQVRTVEGDVLVNRALTWNSYRGPIRNSPVDLRRVLLHEFGHVLGLDHPDTAAPAQSVAAVMNSVVSDTEALQADDMAGVKVLYDTPFAKPVFSTQPTARVVNAGTATSLLVGIDGKSPPAADQFHSYRWYFKAVGAPDFELLFTLHKPGSLDFSLAQSVDAGSYFYRAITPDDTVDSATVTLTVNPVASTPTTALANLSTRGIADSGANSMIVGFVVAGPRAKSVLLRSVGPTLGGAPFNLPGTLGDPRLTLKDSTGTTVATSAAVWDQSTNLAAIRDATGRVGAFALVPGSRDAVLLVSLLPGSYTAQTTSPSSASGVVIVEAYDADATRDTASRLTNLSTRGFVSTGANIMIAGFVVSGPGPRNYLIRVAGDTLKTFGVTGTLDDPYLKIFSGDGRLLREFDDWDSPAASQPALTAAFKQVGAFPLSDRQEPAMLVTLPPGNYTAQVTGLDNDGRSNPRGVALIEVYELP